MKMAQISENIGFLHEEEDQAQFSNSGEILHQVIEEMVDVVEHPPLCILDIPNEILSMIFSYCNATELLRDLSLVCKRFNAVIQSDDSLWRNIYFTYDIYNSSYSLMNYVILKAPRINCVRIQHPGGLSEVSVLQVLNHVTLQHGGLETLEINCHKLSTGYTYAFMERLYSRLGSTLQHLRMQGTLHRSAVLCLPQFSALSTLELNDAYDVIGSDLRKLSDQCLSLNWLGVPRATHILDADLSYFVKRKHSILLGLDLSGYMLSDESIITLCDAPQLVHLSIWDARNLKWGTFSTLRTLRKLRYIRLQRLQVNSLTVTSWLVGSCNLCFLNFLDFQYGYSLDDYVGLITALMCPNLQHLHWGGYLSLKDDTCQLIRNSLRNLLVLSNLPSKRKLVAPRYL